MPPYRPSRRDLLLYSSAVLANCAAGSPVGAAGLQHQHANPTSGSYSEELKFFTKDDAADVDSIAALIIPTDETPGAREAGVLQFIDAALDTFDREKQLIYRKGLEQTREEAAKIATNARRIADLSPEQQALLIERISKSEFFGVIRTHTVMGFLGTYAGQGNRNETGWKLIGFEDKFSFHPPFGHYDSTPG